MLETKLLKTTKTKSVPENGSTLLRAFMALF